MLHNQNYIHKPYKEQDNSVSSTFIYKLKARKFNLTTCGPGEMISTLQSIKSGTTSWLRLNVIILIKSVSNYSTPNR